ncbi:MAG: hypothetical protein K8J08_14185, partial [Thermoanaerobaculia bacterium]|nr:hypothetical protein [Thermoanaerobaculia bacterium]
MKSKALLTLVVVVLGFAIVKSWTQVRQYHRSEAVCTAVEAEDWSRAVRLGEAFSGRPQQERRVTECRCVAFLELDDAAECIADLRERWADSDHADWLPAPAVTAAVVESLRKANDLQGAADLAERGHRVYLGDTTLALFELVLRTQSENEETVLRDLSGRLTPESPPPLRLALTKARKDRREWDEVLALTNPLPDQEPYRGEMLDLRAQAFGMKARVPELRALYGIGEDWRQASIQAIAKYGRLLCRVNIIDPKAYGPDLLFFAADHPEDFEDRELLESVFVILMQYLVLEEDPARLEAVYQQAEEALGEFEKLKPEELERFSILADPNAGPVGSSVTLKLVGNRAGDYVLVSPPPP